MADPLDTLQHWFSAAVAADSPDLSARQMAVLLLVYRQDEPQTVRGMAKTLNVSKPAITRALDRLGELNMVTRKIDPADRRSILAQRTLMGANHLRRLQSLWRESEKRASAPPAAA